VVVDKAAALYSPAPLYIRYTLHTCALFNQPTLVVRHYLLLSTLILFFDYDVMRCSIAGMNRNLLVKRDPLCDDRV
jgi:hypothetical protein